MIKLDSICEKLEAIKERLEEKIEAINDNAEERDRDLTEKEEEESKQGNTAKTAIKKCTKKEKQND